MGRMDIGKAIGCIGVGVWIVLVIMMVVYVMGNTC